MPDEPIEQDPPEERQVKLSDLKRGPLRHESLSDDQVERLRILFEWLSPYLKTTFEQFELNFLRDANPEREILVWSRIALAHQKFLDQEPDVSIAKAERAFKSLVLLSLGAAKPDDVTGRFWKLCESLYRQPT